MTALAVRIVDEQVKQHDRLEQVLIFEREVEIMIFNIVVDILLKRTASVRTVFAQDCDRNKVKAKLFA
jgi:hypothetical protein